MFYIKCRICGTFVEEDKAEIDTSNKEGTCHTCFCKAQDNLAYELSNGEMNNYEDYMQEYHGATICDERDNFVRQK